jgi:RNA polymerase sigma-70 factor (sigma-E family)
VSVRERPDYDAYVAARSPHLLRIAYLLTRDWATAEDVLQTALVKAWFAWRRIHGDPDPYVRKIITTTFTSLMRRRWTREIVTDTLPERAVTGQDRYAEQEALWQLLGELPPKQRAVLVLRYFEDLSVEQTAATLNITEGTVKSQASRALAKLREASELTGRTS